MRRFVGLMSGTSLDAVDAALIVVDDAAARIETIGFASLPIDDALRVEFEALQTSGTDELSRAALAANRLADLYADAVDALLADTACEADSIVAIGAHGQTVRHRPDLGYTIQLLNAARLAERTGVAVVADLRAADVAAGGQGAPLVPAFHARLFRHPDERRAIVNLGGIANVTLLPPGRERDEPIRGYDTGPANTLLDRWCDRHTGKRFDAGGEWARSGTPHRALLDAMLAEAYFSEPPPKSTGRDLFRMDWLESMIEASSRSAGLRGMSGIPPQDVQATLVELTAVTVARACADFGAERVYVCGGGASNEWLMHRLAAHCAPAPCGTTSAEGIDPQSVEAAAFAWLAAQRIDGNAGNLPAVTGARGSRVLGSLAQPRAGYSGVRRTRNRSRRSTTRSDS